MKAQPYQKWVQDPLCKGLKGKKYTHTMNSYSEFKIFRVILNNLEFRQSYFLRKW